MTKQDWRECYWFDKGLNRQRITRQSTARAYISEGLDTIQDRAIEANIDAWVQAQIKDQIAKDWNEYRENLKPCPFETERAWDDHRGECPKQCPMRCCCIDCYWWGDYMDNSEAWEDRALELRYAGEHCDQIPFGAGAFYQMDKDQEYGDWEYRKRYDSDIHFEPLEYQIKIYETHGLVSKGEELKPIKERGLVCFPWQGPTAYSRY